MEVRKYASTFERCINVKSHWFRITAFSLFLVVLSLVSAYASVQQRERPKRPAPAKPPPTPAPEQGLSPTESLERAKNAATQQERIALLEKFIAANRGTPLEKDAREALVRE